MNKINLSVFKNGSFSINSDTELICPDCEKGHLIAAEKNIIKVEYKKYNQNIYNMEDYESEWFNYGFYGFVQCNNKSCNEKIAVSGKLKVNTVYHELGYFKDQIEVTYEEICFPEYFERAPLIIHLDIKYPAEIRLILFSSFSLFWIDKAACANRLRYCIEKLLDLFKIPKKYKSKKGKLLNMNLGNRIDKFCVKYNKYKYFLNAIRWIGNVGSHTDDNKVKNIIDGYRLIDYLLKELYINEEDELIKISKNIVKKKGK